MTDCEVVVIGAGAAGLAAAAELDRRGRSVCVLEARSRIGGRILTERAPGFPAPLELGAEFVHGRPAATVGRLEAHGGAIVDAGGEHWMLHRGRLQRAEGVFAELKRALRRARVPRGDLPFAEFLRAHGRGLSREARQLARLLVEGFDAADATRASTQAILREWRGQGAADAPTYRPLGGYAVLLDALRAALGGARVELESVVEAVRWSRGRVVVTATRRGEAFEIVASAAVIALPLGVLQAGVVRFDPELAAKRSALEGLAAGPVIKVLLRFGSAFWETIDRGRYRNAAFFQSAAAPIPTFWTALPLRVPLLTGWAAGPKAAALAGAGERAIVRAAVASLEALFGVRRRWGARLVAAYVHDWQEDELARGGYSYVVSGRADDARAALAAPLERTLYFAGEAADTAGESGTVAGALQSGLRAGGEAARALARRAR